MVRTGSVYAPVTQGGLRLLVTRYWPRGVKKERVDRWIRELGPAPLLIKDWKSGAISWDEFKKRYRAEFKDPEKKRLFDELKETARAEADVVLLCTCKDEERHCHRSILSAMLSAGR
jgi:uncharacterized protein YeaO (DUF488 family)